jgi:hypothetical protein
MAVDIVVRGQQRMVASFSRSTVWRHDQFNNLLKSTDKVKQKQLTCVPRSCVNAIKRNHYANAGDNQRRYGNLVCKLHFNDKTTCLSR